MSPDELFDIADATACWSVLGAEPEWVEAIVIDEVYIGRPSSFKKALVARGSRATACISQVVVFFVIVNQPIK